MADPAATTRADRVISVVRSQLSPGVEVVSAVLRRHYVRSTEISHWELTYSAPTTVPSRVVAKWSSHPSGSGAREAQFYGMLQEHECRIHLARLLGYSAFPDGELLVLKDLSPEFVPAVSRPSGPIPPERNIAVFEALRAVHCDLWETPRVREFDMKSLALHQAVQLAARRETILGNLRSRPGMPPSACDLTDRVTARLPELRLGVLSRTNALTIIHGDAHPGNALVSDGSGRCSAVLIDWPNWQPGFPTDDLAYYLSLCFPASERVKQERELLRHYHGGLPQRIQNAYSRGQLETDYRLSLVRCLATAFLWIACPSPPQWAWDSLEFVLDSWRAWEGETVLRARGS